MNKFDLVMAIVIAVLITLLVLQIIERVWNKVKRHKYMIFYMSKDKKKENTWIYNTCIMNCKTITGDFEVNKQIVMEMEREIGKKFNLKFVRITGMLEV